MYHSKYLSFDLAGVDPLRSVKKEPAPSNLDRAPFHGPTLYLCIVQGGSRQSPQGLCRNQSRSTNKKRKKLQSTSTCTAGTRNAMRRRPGRHPLPVYTVPRPGRHCGPPRFPHRTRPLGFGVVALAAWIERIVVFSLRSVSSSGESGCYVSPPVVFEQCSTSARYLHTVPSASIYIVPTSYLDGNGIYILGPLEHIQPGVPASTRCRCIVHMRSHLRTQQEHAATRRPQHSSHRDTTTRPLTHEHVCHGSIRRCYGTACHHREVIRPYCGGDDGTSRLETMRTESRRTITSVPLPQSMVHRTDSGPGPLASPRAHLHEYLRADNPRLWRTELVSTRPAACIQGGTLY